jgi:hypothetical protein
MRQALSAKPLHFLLLVLRMLPAPFAKFVHFQLFFFGSLAFINKIIVPLASRALKFY